ncbi:hypothetical protein SLA2020_276160 [Shorea laevis]
MALYSLRLRRTLTSLSKLHRSLSAVPVIPAISTPALQSPLLQGSTSTPSHPWTLLVQSRPFRLTTVALFSARATKNSDITEEIGGCDFNHWLIVMSFPEDDKPTPEQMVQTYEETCAKGLNISVEEAKKKIYACSTTTYKGFQVVMTEEESNLFQGLPGEYGGDKYINGTIIPRPLAVKDSKQGRNHSSIDGRYGREAPFSFML